MSADAYRFYHLECARRSCRAKRDFDRAKDIRPGRCASCGCAFWTVLVPKRKP